MNFERGDNWHVAVDARGVYIRYGDVAEPVVIPSKDALEIANAIQDLLT